MSEIDTFAEAEALVDGVGPRPPGSDAERRAAQHLAERLGGLGREVVVEPFAVWPAWAVGYSINAILAVIGSVLSVSSAKLGTGLVLLATILTFLDLAGITPTTRRLLGRRASQNVVSWGVRERPGSNPLETLGLGPTMHRKVFAAIHGDRARLRTPEDMAAFALKNGADPIRFMTAYGSPEVTALCQQARQLAEAYKIDAVPAMGVHGRYYTNGNLANAA